MVRSVTVATVAVVATVAWLAVVPLVVIETFASLIVLAIIVTGAAILVGRVGAVDLSVGAAAGLGAYAGGVAAANLGWPPLLSLFAGALAGSVASGSVGAVVGRVGRTAGALASLATGGAIVALLSVWPEAGGAAGFHAVPLFTGSTRGDLAVLVVAFVGVLIVAGAFVQGRLAARAAVSVASRAVAASLGTPAWVATSVVGGVAGAILGLGGAGLATASGSVVPAAFGLPFTAAILVAGLLAGAPPWGPPTATLVVWGLPVLFAWLPGDASGALVGGTVGLSLLALRRGRPLFAWPSQRPEMEIHAATAPRRRGGQGTLEVDLPQISGGRVRFRAEPGQIVALVGPNGSGKSTLLARIGGQLPDGGGVRLRGHALPRGAAPRARAGVARTWQRGVAVPQADATRSSTATSEDQEALGLAAAIVGRHGVDQLLRLAARRPAVALLDEPAAQHPPVVVRAFLRHLARAGAVVVVAEHEPRTIDLADHVIRLERP